MFVVNDGVVNQRVIEDKRITTPGTCLNTCNDFDITFEVAELVDVFDKYDGEKFEDDSEAADVARIFYDNFSNDTMQIAAVHLRSPAIIANVLELTNEQTEASGTGFEQDAGIIKKHSRNL